MNWSSFNNRENSNDTFPQGFCVWWSKTVVQFLNYNHTMLKKLWKWFLIWKVQPFWRVFGVTSSILLKTMNFNSHRVIIRKWMNFIEKFLKSDKSLNNLPTFHSYLSTNMAKTDCYMYEHFKIGTIIEDFLLWRKLRNFHVLLFYISCWFHLHYWIIQ